MYSSQEDWAEQIRKGADESFRKFRKLDDNTVGDEEVVDEKQRTPIKTAFRYSPQTGLVTRRKKVTPKELDNVEEYSPPKELQDTLSTRNTPNLSPISPIGDFAYDPTKTPSYSKSKSVSGTIPSALSQTLISSLSNKSQSGEILNSVNFFGGPKARKAPAKKKRVNTPKTPKSRMKSRSPYDKIESPTRKMQYRRYFESIATPPRNALQHPSKFTKAQLETMFKRTVKRFKLLNKENENLAKQNETLKKKKSHDSCEKKNPQKQNSSKFFKKN